MIFEYYFNEIDLVILNYHQQIVFPALCQKKNRLQKKINKAAWNSRTEVDFDSDFYNNVDFVKTLNIT